MVINLATCYEDITNINVQASHKRIPKYTKQKTDEIAKMKREIDNLMNNSWRFQYYYDSIIYWTRPARKLTLRI